MNIVLVVLVLCDARAPSKADDVLCGQRCVTYVLNRYEQPCELFDVVQEMQSLGVDGVVSLRRIQSILVGHKLSVRPVRLRYGERLAGDCLVIVHRPSGQNDDTGDVGHFLVWLPTSSEAVVQIWDGLKGIQEVPSDDFYESISPIVLLAMPPNLMSDQSPAGFRLSAFMQHWGIAITCLVGSVLFVFFFPRS